jgi:hypothetical protein
LPIPMLTTTTGPLRRSHVGRLHPRRLPFRSWRRLRQRSGRLLCRQRWRLDKRRHNTTRNA